MVAGRRATFGCNVFVVVAAVHLLACSSVDHEPRYYDNIADPPADVQHLDGCADVEPELNDWANLGVPLGTIDVCGPAKTVDGMLAGVKDVDYFSFVGNDAVGCGAMPSATASGHVALCIFPVCYEGGVQVKCSHGEPRASSAELIGCCADDGKPVISEFHCSDPVPERQVDATVYARAYVASDGSDSCTPYTITYSY